jgi:large subunit ribosomal protein L35
MPKMKTHRGAAKRFKKTASGQGSSAAGVHQPHPDQEVAEAEAEQLRGTTMIAKADEKRVKRLLSACSRSRFHDTG